MTREEIHKQIYEMGVCKSSSQRHAVTDCIVDLSHRDRWQAQDLRHALKEMEERDELTRDTRYKLQKEFFPE